MKAKILPNDGVLRPLYGTTDRFGNLVVDEAWINTPYCGWHTPALVRVFPGTARAVCVETWEEAKSP